MHRCVHDAVSEEEQNISRLCTFKLRAQFGDTEREREKEKEREQAYKSWSPE